MEQSRTHALISIDEVERERLRALERYQAVTSDSTINFDDITKLASQICGAPMAMVTLIDKDTAWVKSAIGLKLDSIPRQEVFCNHTLEQNFFMVEDLLLNEGFCIHPWVTSNPSIRFYAGAALTNKAGHNLGTLCVMDKLPRKLTASQKDCLKALAGQVIQLLESKLARDRLKKDFYELQRLSKISMDQQIKMINSARMTSLGEMANGVAHEVNNPLNVIDHAIEKLNRTQLYDGASIAIIQKATQRLVKIIRALRDLSQDGSRYPQEVINLKEILSDTLELFASRAKEEGIIFELEVDPDHFIEAKHCQMVQILSHLIQNAFQAVTLVKERRISLSTELVGGEILINVRDTGPGIAPEISPRIFEPFFSTKPSESSSGLGLFISRRLAEENGGELFYQEGEKPTRFVLKFKRVTQALH